MSRHSDPDKKNKIEKVPQRLQRKLTFGECYNSKEDARYDADDQERLETNKQPHPHASFFPYSSIDQKRR